MNLKLLRQIIIMSKYTLYGMILQVFCLSLLFAETGKAQNESLKDIRLTVNWENARLKKVFHDLNTKTGFKFNFHDAEINVNKKVTLSLAENSMDEVLRVLSKQADIKFRRINGNIHVGKNEFSQRPVIEYLDYADVEISGQITDENGEGLPGASVVVKGTSQGTTTDIDGNYKLNVQEGATITVSFVGYTTKELIVGAQSVIDIQMELDAAQLEEVVVVGYGVVKKSDLTGSVSSVSSEKITQVPVSSVARALQGQAAGVTVTQPSGQPGQSVTIRIRGNNSISGGNNPLYVIDGFPSDELGSDLNAEDIASVEILKDASATAIYGSRGSNGVVLITTKRGEKGKISVDYHGFHGVQQLRNKIELLGRDDYAAMVNEAAVNDGGTPVYSASDIAALPDNDWHDLTFRNAKMSNHQLSVSGGNESTQYYASLNYFNQEGIVNNSGFDRISFRANGDQKIGNRFNLRTSVNYMRSTYNQANDAGADGWGGIPFTVNTMPPIEPIVDEDGNYSVFSGVPWGGTNPVGMSENDIDRRTDNRLLGNVELNWNIIEGLNFRTSVGLNYLASTTDAYRKIGIVGNGAPDGQARKVLNNRNSFVNENILSYNKEIDQHSFGAVVGFTYQSDHFDQLSANGNGFVSDVFENNLLQSAATVGVPSTSFWESKLVSYLGRINYTYNDKYLFTISGRYDGSSKFGKNNKYAFFPSAAFAWRISDESFLIDSDKISNLKFRSSYGKSGNQAVSPYQTLARMSTTSVFFGDGQDVGFVLSSFDNADLKWEVSSTLDFGVDLGLVQDRIGLTVDYYIINTNDLLYNAILPTSSGFTASVRNVGEMENKGFEFELTTKNFVTDFKWETSLNMSFNRNKVVSLGADGLGNPIERINAPGSGGNWFPLFVGEPGQQLIGYEIAGIYETNEEADENGEPTKIAGDYKYVDQDGNGIVNSDDQILLTNLQPDFTFGFNNSFSYKNFDLSVFLVGSVGNDVVNEFAKYYTAITGDWNVTQEAWDNRWTGPGSGGTFPRSSATQSAKIRGGGPTSLWVEDGTYVKFRDITLGYNFPSSITEKIGFNSLKLYVSGQNLITITNYSHYDPEAAWERAPVTGWDRGVYPSTKSVTFGVKANF